MLIKRYARETELQRDVEQLYESTGWQVFHDHDPTMNRAGFPDFHAGHEKFARAIQAELKMPGETPTWPQVQWLNAYSAAHPGDTFLWYPDDWPTIQKVAQNEIVSSATTWWYRKLSLDLHAIEQRWLREQARKPTQRRQQPTGWAKHQRRYRRRGN